MFNFSRLLSTGRKNQLALASPLCQWLGGYRFPHSDRVGRGISDHHLTGVFRMDLPNYRMGYPARNLWQLDPFATQVDEPVPGKPPQLPPVA